MNKDIEMLNGSDYVLRFEFLGEDNLDFEFVDTDNLTIQFSDVSEKFGNTDNINLFEFQNPLEYTIKNDDLSIFTSDPVKYNLILYRSNVTLSLLSGNIYRK